MATRAAHRPAQRGGAVPHPGLEPAVRKVLSEHFVDSEPELVEDVIRGVALSNLEELIAERRADFMAWWTAPDRLDGDEPRGLARRACGQYSEPDHPILRREEAANGWIYRSTEAWRRVLPPQRREVAAKREEIFRELDQHYPPHRGNGLVRQTGNRPGAGEALSLQDEWRGGGEARLRCRGRWRPRWRVWPGSCCVVKEHLEQTTKAAEIVGGDQG